METTYHRPVLLDQTIEALGIRPDGIYLDGTAGGGGGGGATTTAGAGVLPLRTESPTSELVTILTMSAARRRLRSPLLGP